MDIQRLLVTLIKRYLWSLVRQAKRETKARERRRQYQKQKELEYQATPDTPPRQVP